MGANICDRLRELLRWNLHEAFGLDLDGVLRVRKRELWILGVDARTKRITDVCGTIDSGAISAINSRGFSDTDAGFRADVQDAIPGIDTNADAFLLNVEHFDKPDSFIGPLVVHEQAHYLEQTGVPPSPSDADSANAGALLVSLRSNIRRIHNLAWAQHLSTGARKVVASGKVSQTSIRDFLEAAVPACDRNGSISIRE